MIGWSPSAARDFEALREFLGERSPERSDIVAGRILSAVASLDLFPYRGRVGKMAGTRELVVARTP